MVRNLALRQELGKLSLFNKMGVQCVQMNAGTGGFGKTSGFPWVDFYLGQQTARIKVKS